MTLNTQLIEDHWNGIGPRQHELVERFYQRLFERYPQYRKLFPAAMGPQMEKMVQTLALVATAADQPKVIRPRLRHVGQAHANLGLKREDFDHFIRILLEVLGEYNTEAWSEQCRESWREALERVILPTMQEGMEKGQH